MRRVEHNDRVGRSQPACIAACEHTPAQVAVPSGEEEMPWLPKHLAALAIWLLLSDKAVRPLFSRIDKINAKSGGSDTRMPIGLACTPAGCGATTTAPQVQIPLSSCLPPVRLLSMC
ncbi:hypothetical protein GK047_09800 [Paenibacillus sp. SYP-B3998]|uniref:Uncharacterized protein n=1 Tax=Paenibacillus sp. SYP-B3998 TaxID=2678564 RepID=A0A6G3ZW15_9BACL|nr:hypothetical protein [Paenibacillus sp. SYP-B3998]NEW06305.1 hypothetical protein [Paenibacillus sp. SYP-B3998]